MIKYKILSRKMANKNSFTYLAVNYISPSMVKLSSSMKLYFGSFIHVDNEVAYYKKRFIGKIIDYKSANDVLVNTDYSIKYTGGYSLDGSKVFLDKNFPKFVIIGNKLVNTIESIAKHHEIVEKWLIDFGYTYSYSHRLATAVERDFIKMLGVKWKDYDHLIAKYLHENYKRKLENSPLDLDLLPYLESNDALALKEIKESMNTDILYLENY